MTSQTAACVCLLAVLPFGQSLSQAAGPEPPRAPEERLNVMIVSVDDMNWDSMGWLGSTMNATPHIDEFARTAYGFLHSHVAAPICTPSREAFMTGLLPHRSGALGFDPIYEGIQTLPQILQENGYYTAVIHKVNHMRPKAQFPWDFVAHEGEGRGHVPAKYRDDVSRAFQAAADARKPLFLNVNINDPHRPFYGEPRDERGTKLPEGMEYKLEEVPLPHFLPDIPGMREEVWRYWNSTRRADWSFSEVMAALQESGQSDRTAVVFLTDNGMSIAFAKTTPYRPGTNAALLVRWPDVPKPKLDRLHVVSAIDIMPTILDLLGIAPPADLDARSLLPILNGQRQPHRDHVFTYLNTIASRVAYPSRCIRTRHHSYIWNAWSDGAKEFHNDSYGNPGFKSMMAAAKSDPRISARVEMFLHRVSEEFYDLQADPYEQRNLIDDPSAQEEITRLRELVFEKMNSSGDPLLSAWPPGSGKPLPDLSRGKPPRRKRSRR